MDIMIYKEKGWTEVVIDSNCDFNRFYLSAEILKNYFAVDFHSKMDVLDSLYWDFRFKGSELSLHYNVFAGISIISTSFSKATFDDNENVVEIGKLLIEKLNSKD